MLGVDRSSAEATGSGWMAYDWPLEDTAKWYAWTAGASRSGRAASQREAEELAEQALEELREEQRRRDVEWKLGKS